jgi:hypothetical protein
MYRSKIADGWKTTRDEHQIVPWDNLPRISIDLVIPETYLDPLVLEFKFQNGLLTSEISYPGGLRILTSKTDGPLTTFYDNEGERVASLNLTRPAIVDVEHCVCYVNNWLCPGAVKGYGPVFSTPEFPHLTGDRQHQGVSPLP